TPGCNPCDDGCEQTLARRWHWRIKQEHRGGREHAPHQCGQDRGVRHGTAAVNEWKVLHDIVDLTQCSRGIVSGRIAVDGGEDLVAVEVEPGRFIVAEFL